MTAAVTSGEGTGTESADASAAQWPTLPHTRLAGMRILLADDGEVNQLLISHFLRTAGATVSVVPNGRRAVEALSAGGAYDAPLASPPPFDLLLTDMQMPELDGYGAVRLLRSRGSSLPIVALTAHEIAAAAEACLAAGCDAYASKPIDRHRLIELCAKWGARPSEPLYSTLVDETDTAPLLRNFVAGLKRLSAALTAALGARDWNGVASLSHHLKGAAGGYGFQSISDLARQVETLARDGSDSRALHEVHAQLVDQCQRATADRPATGAPAPSAAGAPRPAQAVSGARQSVLLVDDAPEVHDLVAWQLRELDLELTHAYSGSEGLRHLETGAPDLVLLDYQLPDIDGLKVLRQLRSRPDTSELSVIFLTAAEDDDTQQLAFESGAVDYVRKPFRAAELRARVRAALRTQALLSRLEMQASTDRLTGMLNRDALLARLEQAMTRARAAPGRSYAVLFLDFDGFKLLNDAYGHDAGDELLRQVGARLHAAMPANAAVASARHATARLGGDEFVVVLEDLSGREEAERCADGLLQSLSREYSIKGHRVVSSVSIGVVLAQDDYVAPSDLLRDADAAMYEAKAAGRGRYAMFERSMRRRIEERVDLERELRLALETQQLHLLYQPIVALDGGAIVGLEALLRWHHATRGPITPSKFISVAVDSGLIHPLGDWVMHKACDDFARLRARMGARAPEFLGVNVSRMQLNDRALPAKIRDVLAHSALEPRRLHLEITETELVTNFANARETVEAVKRLGLCLAVDDFGIGYSSLASLHDYPIDVFKLDRSFITRDFPTKRGRALLATAHAMIQLARNIGVRVIAEGIETPEQLAILQSLGCDMAQGYLLGRPMSIEQIPGFRILHGVAADPAEASYRAMRQA